MKFQELKSILIRLYKEYIKKHLKKIFGALVLSLCVAGSTSATAWLLWFGGRSLGGETTQYCLSFQSLLMSECGLNATTLSPLP